MMMIAQGQPTGDAVDSDRFIGLLLQETDGLILPGFAVLNKTLTVFTHLACSWVANAQ